MRILLDGQTFDLQAGTGVTRTPIVEFPTNIRLAGQQKRQDRSLLSTWAIDNWEGGLGIERRNVDKPNQDYRLWDVENCDTRWASQIVLSPAFNTCTIVPSRSDAHLAMDYDNQIYFVETTRLGSAPNGSYAIFSYAYQFSPPLTLGSYRALGQGRATSGYGVNVGSVFGLKVLGDKILLVLIGGSDNDIDTRYNYVATLGGTLRYQIVSEAPQLSSATSANLSRFAQFADLGGTVHLLAYYSSSKNVGFDIIDSNLTSLSRIASISSEIGTQLAPLVSDGVKVYAALPRGIYDFDASPAPIIDTERTKDKNVHQVMFGNELYFKNKYSLMHYDGSVVTMVGYDKEDGLPNLIWGEITAMVSTWKYIFTAVKGATYAHILTMDTNRKWQYYARMPSPGLWVREMFLSDSPDNIDRLWCIYQNYGYHGYFLNPMVNPLQAATYSFVPTGYFTPPIFDGGMPEEPGAFYQKGVIGNGLGASNFIDCYYGLNGNAPTTYLGQIASITQTLIYGSPYGVNAYRLQPRFLLSGSPAGTTPVFQSAIEQYLKLPATREQFDFTIDLALSARQPVPIEAMVASLDALSNLTSLVPFQYGLIATRNVKVISPQAREEVRESQFIDNERTGLVKLTVAEIL